MKFGVVVFPGSNCDQDMVDAVHAFGQPVVKLWHKQTDLENCEVIVLPGGFSYGDYLRSGAIARFSPIMKEVVRFAEKGGYVLAICNGFQVATEAGLLPGALLRNTAQKFSCKNVFLKANTQNTIFSTKSNAQATYKIPIAHGEGRYYADTQTLQELKAQDQIVFTYCDAQGVVTEEANPNGSLWNIAGICNKNRNVLGMMPHPERAVDADLRNTDGKVIFESLLSL